jgi:hypothetical protein
MEDDEEDDDGLVGALNFKEVANQLRPIVCSRAFRRIMAVSTLVGA